MGIKANKIKRILAEVRPYIKSHGGGVRLLGVKKNIVTLMISGACANCPLAKLTYNKVVRGLIKEKVPEVQEVVFKNIKKKVKRFNTRPVRGKSRHRVVTGQNGASNGMANQKEYPRAKDGSNIGKIVVDRDLCIGAASCVAVAPATFELDAENKVIAIDANAVDDETLKMAAQSCPTKAILLFDKEGEQIPL